MAQTQNISQDAEREGDTAAERIAEISTLLVDAEDVPSAERVTHLLDAAEQIKSLKADGNQRFSLFEHCYAISIETIRELNRAYFGLTLPLQPKQEVQVKTAVNLAETIDSFYSRIIVGETSDRYGLILHRRLALLLEQFTFCSTAYAPCSDGLWTRIHALYRDAHDHHVVKYKPNDVPGESESLSIRNLYLIAVMTGAADPYQMPYRDTQKVRNIAHTMIDRMKLLAPGKKPPIVVTGELTYLLADARINKPALPYRAGKSMHNQALLVDITKALSHLKKRLLVLERDPSVKDPLFEKEPAENTTALYRHLIVKWGWQPIRGAARNTVNIDFQVILGYKNILQELEWNPTSSIDIDENMDLEDDEESITMSGDSIIIAGEAADGWRSAENEDESDFSLASSIDVSSTGYGLRLTSMPETGLRVGELIALRERSHRGHWTLGVVRWIKTVSGGALETGILKVPGIAQFALLRSVDVVRQADLLQASDDEGVPVLIAKDPESPDKIKARLIVPVNIGPVETVSWLTFSKRDRMIDTMRKFLSTRYISCFSCRLSEPRDMPTLSQQVNRTDKRVFS